MPTIGEIMLQRPVGPAGFFKVTCLVAVVSWISAPPAAGQNIAGTLLEAEDFWQKVSSAPGFARPYREPAASARKVLVGFSEEGYVLYRFQVAAAGKHAVWLRYAANKSVQLGVDLDPQGTPAFTKLTMPGTGGLRGPDVWGWARLYDTHLAAGLHTLAMHKTSLRPDCIYVTTSSLKPTDAVIQADPYAHLKPAQRALLKIPLAKVRPTWLEGAPRYRLPTWYDEQRVQAHTRFGQTYLGREVFFRVAEHFRAMGAPVFVRQIQAHIQGAWWPSCIEPVHPLASVRDIAREIIDNAHYHDCRLIAYHAHMYDLPLSEQHPDWMCLDDTGQPIIVGMAPMMCFNSPYPDYFLTRALELVDMDVDGLYFDYVHMPKTGCWCHRCKAMFKAMTGLDHPPAHDLDDPVWRKLVEFNNLVIEKTFLKWRRAIHERDPDLVMVVGSHLWSRVSDHHLNSRLFRIADAVKMEHSIPVRPGSDAIFKYDPSMKTPEPDVRLALGYTLVRDAADGRPAHVWVDGLKDETSMLHATAGVVAHGCIADLDVREETFPNFMFTRAFDLGGRISPFLAGTLPVRWAVVHYSEVARDAFALYEIQQWKKVLYPLHGAYMAFLRARLPVGIVTDSQLEEGLPPECKILFLPYPDLLTEPMKRKIRDFQVRGGRVIEQRETWKWHDPNGGQETALQSFLKEIKSEADQAPIQVFGGPEKLHAVVYMSEVGNRITLALANEFSWVSLGQKPPPPCTGVKIVLRDSVMPMAVFDAVRNLPLTPHPVTGGIEIAVPGFETLAVVVVEY